MLGLVRQSVIQAGNKQFTQNMAVMYANLRALANFVQDASSKYLLIQFFDKTNIYRLIQDVYKSSTLEELADPDSTIKTRLACGRIIDQVTEADTRQLVSDKLMDAGLLEALI